MTTKTSETPELQLQDGETAIDVSMADMAGIDRQTALRRYGRLL